MYQCSDDYSDIVIATGNLKKFATRGSRYDKINDSSQTRERKESIAKCILGLF